MPKICTLITRHDHAFPTASALHSTTLDEQPPGRKAGKFSRCCRDAAATVMAVSRQCAYAGLLLLVAKRTPKLDMSRWLRFGVILDAVMKPLRAY